MNINLQDIGKLRQALPYVNFKHQEDSANPVIIARVQNQQVLVSLKNYNIFKEKNADPDFVSQYRDSYLLVRTDGTMYVSRSKSQCLGAKGNDGHAFLGLIGYDPDDDSMNTILTL
jgi:hypothetical protein